jgi:hypothetical protein
VGDPPRPRRRRRGFRLLFLAQSRLDRLHQSGDRGVLVRALREQGQRGAGVGTQPEERGQALAVGHLAVVPDADVGGEPLGDVDEERRGPGVQAARPADHHVRRGVSLQLR